MKLQITLLLEEGDTHPATLSIPGSAHVVLNTVDQGHITVDADQVTIGTIEPPSYSNADEQQY